LILVASKNRFFPQADENFSTICVENKNISHQCQPKNDDKKFMAQNFGAKKTFSRFMIFANFL
jgi:hypothetical protein